MTSRCKSLLEVCCLHPNHKDKCKRGPIRPTRNTKPLCGKRNDAGLPQTTDLKVKLPCAALFSKIKIKFFQPSVGESEFGEWPHVCILLRKEYVGTQVSASNTNLWKLSLQIKVLTTLTNLKMVKDQLVKVYQCGASLISDKVVLTSGHCVNNTE